MNGDNLQNEPLWTAQDVANFLKTSRSWVYHRVESGLMPCVRVGGMVRFRPADIRAMLEPRKAATIIEMKLKTRQK